MNRCKDCVYRNLYMCDKHGEIPVERIELSIDCKDFEALEDGSKVLLRWRESAPIGTMEREYLDEIISAMDLSSPYGKTFDKAITWIYTIPDSKDARALRSACFVFPVESPI